MLPFDGEARLNSAASAIIDVVVVELVDDGNDDDDDDVVDVVDESDLITSRRFNGDVLISDISFDVCTFGSSGTT